MMKGLWSRIKSKLKVGHKNKENSTPKEIIRKILYYICVCVFIYSVSSIVLKFYNDYKTQRFYEENRQSPLENIDYDPSLPEQPESFELIDADDELNSYSAYPKLGKFDVGDSLAPNGMAINRGYDSLIDLNEDVVGYLRIPGTVIDYPVLQKLSDNDYYLHHDINHVKTDSASIFLDYRNRIYNEDKNTILYGHNMRLGHMFAALHKYKDWSFAKEHRKIFFDTLYETQEWEIFAVFRVHKDYPYIDTAFRNDEEFQKFIDGCVSMSDHNFGIKPTVNDRVLTLSTCERRRYEDYRYVVQAVLVKRTPR